MAKKSPCDVKLFPISVMTATSNDVWQTLVLTVYADIHVSSHAISENVLLVLR